MDNSTKNFGIFQNLRNIASNISIFVVNLLISLWFTPYLIRNLGSEVFGFVPLANSVANFLGIITNSVNLSTGRYLTIEIEKQNLEESNQIFNTALLGTILLISAATPIALIVIILAPVLFNIPPNLYRDVQLLFTGTMAAFLLTTFRINFTVASYARNRFDLRNIVNLAARIGQICVIILLFNLDEPKLFYVGIGAFSAALFGFIGDFYLWKLLLPTLMISLQAFRRKYLEHLVGTGTWMFVYQVGAIVLLNMDMLVANRTLDLNLAGMFGALLTIPKNLRIMASAVGGIWGPTILSRYSKSDYTGIDNVILISTKLIGITLALPVGFLVGMAKPFLSLWLGTEFESIAPVLIVMAFPLSATLILGPFFNTQISMNKLKTPALVTISLGMINIIMMVGFSKIYGPLGIALAGAIVWTIRAIFFMPIYTAHILDLAWWRYLVRLLPIIFVTLLVSIVTYFVSVFIPITSLLALIVVGVVVSICYLIAIYLFGLSRNEKDLVNGLLQKVTTRRE
jgi:membrane protein EpsK